MPSRYDPVGFNTMTLHDDGSWVAWEDYEKLEAERDGYRERVETLTKERDEAHRCLRRSKHKPSVDGQTWVPPVNHGYATLRTENARLRARLQAAEAVVTASRWCCGGTRPEEKTLRGALDAYDEAAGNR